MDPERLDDRAERLLSHHLCAVITGLGRMSTAAAPRQQTAR